MKKHFLLLLLMTIMVSACEKDVEGCTDSASLSYNPDANIDDGTCQYLSDYYTGVYLAKDTVTFIDPNTLLPDTIIHDEYIFSITKTGNETINIRDFCYKELNANVTEKFILLTNADDCDIYSAIITRNANTIKYSYNSPYSGDYSGVAVKQ